MRVQQAVALGAFVVVTTLSAGAQNASQPLSMVTTMGIGAGECSTWLRSPRTEEVGIAWILGAWSGMNMANTSTNRQVGNTLGPQAIVAAIKLRCQRSPQSAVSDVLHAFYAEAWSNGQ